MGMDPELTPQSPAPTNAGRSGRRSLAIGAALLVIAMALPGIFVKNNENGWALGAALAAAFVGWPLAVIGLGGRGWIIRYLSAVIGVPLVLMASSALWRSGRKIPDAGAQRALQAAKAAQAPPRTAAGDGASQSTSGAAPAVKPTDLAGVIADGMAAGDLDRDGKADVVTGEIKANIIRVFRGDGTGKFIPGQVISFKNRYLFPRTLALADLDGDGILDLVVASWREEEYGGWRSSGGLVEVFRGKGDGTFGESRSYRTGAQASALAVGDFNGDGVPDVVTDKEVLLGSGGGEMETSSHEIKGTGEPALEIAVADLDGDGLADVVIAENSGVVRVAAGQKLKPDQHVLSVTYKKTGIVKIARREAVKGRSELIVVAAEGAGRQVRGCRVVGAVGVSQRSRQSLRCAATDMTDHCVEYEGRLNNFLQCRPLPVPPGDVNPEVLAVGNVGGKGPSDVAIAEKSAASLVLWGSAGSDKKPGLRLPGVADPSLITVADIDGNGAGDLIIASAKSRTVQAVIVSQDAAAAQDAKIAEAQRRREECVEEHLKNAKAAGAKAGTGRSGAKHVPVECLEPGSNERRMRCDGIVQGREKLAKADPFHADLNRFYNQAYNQCVEDMGGPTRGIVFEHCGDKSRKLLVDYCADPTGAPEKQRAERRAERRREECASTLDAIARGQRTPQGAEKAWWDPVEKPWRACLAEYGFRREAAVVCANRGITDSFMRACMSAP